MTANGRHESRIPEPINMATSAPVALPLISIGVAAVFGAGLIAVLGEVAARKG